MIGLVVTVIGDVVVTAAVLFVALTVVYWFGHLHGWRAAARHLRAHNPDASTVLPDLPPLPLRLR
ncbi:hypothetical protein, partial [Nocardia terpenica]